MRLAILASISCVLLVAPPCLAQGGSNLVGTDPLGDGGAVDGWSTINVMYGSVLPVGETVNTVNYYPADNRIADVEDEFYRLSPMIIRQEGGSRENQGGFFTIHAIGPTHIPSEGGEQSFAWGSQKIPNDGALYHPGFLGWLDSANDANGGLVSFAGGSGKGMTQFNVDTTDYLPDDLGELEAGFELTGLQTHSSAKFDGREYQFNFEMSGCDETCAPLEPTPPPPPDPSIVGTQDPANGGAVDGWSAITVMSGQNVPAGEKVNTVRYYTANNRSAAVEDELYNVVPMIVKQEGGSLDSPDGDFSIFDIGPTHTPNEPGLQEFAWESMEIPDDGEFYHPGFLGWQQDVDNSNGGIVSFAGNGGEGVIQYDVDSTDFVPGEDLGDLDKDFLLTGLTQHTSGRGGRQYQFHFQIGGPQTAGDFNGDELVDAVDMDLLSVEVEGRTGNLEFDLNEDGELNQDDRTAWVKDIKCTWFGDSNLDGEFNSTDFVEVFQGAQFETGVAAGWALGDWDGDGVFSSSDFVVAFQDGGFEQGPLVKGEAVSAVPEPTGLFVLVFGLLAICRMRWPKSSPATAWRVNPIGCRARAAVCIGANAY